jgi:hypothetical protein
MSLAVVHAAEWHGEFVAHLEAQATRLHETKMMRIRRLAGAD